MPGLFIGQHAGGGKAEQLFLRGFDLDHGTDVRLSVDGMPVNMVSHAHGQGYADLHFVIPELVQGLDFGKGPYAPEQGNLATAGWVNFRTRTALDSSFAKLEAGPYDTYRAVAAVDVRRLARLTDGWTGADIVHACESAAELALIDAAAPACARARRLATKATAAQRPAPACGGATSGR